MPIDYRNTNTLWASVLVETLYRLGLKTVIVCPGSRSAPLAIAFANHPKIDTLSILDERSAAFFALGHARKTHIPVALVCTSGTAGANFYPAIIEAYDSGVPLIAFTADRPPELRHCHAGQAIDQVKLYGNYPQWQVELSLPESHLQQLAYLRQTLRYAWERSLWPSPGPVHLNCPFRDPLVPITAPVATELQGNEEEFFQDLQPIPFSTPSIALEHLPIEQWQECDRGLIIAGPAQPQDPQKYCEAIAILAKTLGWPVLAEGLSPLRNYADLNPNLISGYAIAFKNPDCIAPLTPEMVLRIGELPICKELRQWLSHQSCPQWIIDPRDHNLDATHSHATHLRLSIESLSHQLSGLSPSFSGQYLETWLDLDAQIRTHIEQQMSQMTELQECKIAWTLAKQLPAKTPLFISNSMPVRDVEWFWPPGHTQITPFFNRGANGIDGILSSALGIAHQAQPSVLLTGDLAFLHDTNGLLPNPRWQGHLTIIMVNNDGGGIFEMLPVSQFNPPFEEYFATPQSVDIAKLCEAYGHEYQLVSEWDELISTINSLPSSGIRVLEVKCDRKINQKQRRLLFEASHSKENE